jgi:hypothetical protein
MAIECQIRKHEHFVTIPQGEESFATRFGAKRIAQIESETQMARFRFLDKIFGVGGPLSRFRKAIPLDEAYPEQINDWAKRLKTDIESSSSELEKLRGKYQVKPVRKDADKKPKKKQPKGKN